MLTQTVAAQFNPRPEYRLTRLKFFAVFSQSAVTDQDNSITAGHNGFQSGLF